MTLTSHSTPRAANSGMVLMADGLQFPEGPVVLKDGSVLLVEIKRRTLTRVQPDGTYSVVAELDGGPNGVAIGPDGAAYVCNNGGFEWSVHDGLDRPGGQPADYIGGRIQRVELEGPSAGTVTDLYTECEGHPLIGPNDIVFDDYGGFWFTDAGKQRDRDSSKGGLYYALADGSSITEVVYPMNIPNGVGLSPDGGRLYVSETATARVWSWEIETPGRLRNSGSRGPGGAELLHGLGGFQALDSLAVDSEGNVCVATLYTGAISVVAPNGTLIDQIAVPEPDYLVTNICFAGSDSRTAYVTSSGRGYLYKMEWHCNGLDPAYSI